MVVLEAAACPGVAGVAVAAAAAVPVCAGHTAAM